MGRGATPYEGDAAPVEVGRAGQDIAHTHASGVLDVTVSSCARTTLLKPNESSSSSAAA